MTTLQLSPLITNISTALAFFVSSSQWVNSYDRLEVWRSRTTADGPYELLTTTNVPAILPLGFAGTQPQSPATGPDVVLNNKTLQFYTAGQLVNIVFLGSDPFTMARAATAINAQGQGLLFSYVADDGTLVVQTVASGSKNYLWCTAGEAASLLGFDTDPSQVAFGADARILLREGVENYGYVDTQGSTDFFYKIRFFNSVSGLTSEYSLPFQGPTAPAVPASNLVRCYLDLSDAQGRAAPGKEVLVYVKFTGATAPPSFTVADQPTTLLTDANGHAELQLVRGLTVTVSIGGTDLVRDFVVPTDPTVVSVNMLDPAVGSNDLFNVSVPNLDYAVRRSL